MAKLIHRSPLGALEIGGVLGRPEPGEPFDAPTDIAATLLEQAGLYSPADYKTTPVELLAVYAEARGVEHDGKKAAIIAALVAADAEEAKK
ncbi:hypothetical protein JNB63_02130 [Microbacterium trichothecenolyticum]|uniref:hypothetical protein n=1 Tax=Microbacterium trichothecenolyticum TaxID=69370 RepID=UPI001C6E22AA|nr:hypothetical protein [Microbacterium trichothecenolyticum]MBW9118884.1 hypothetical protein [Microbacterium trichothecenolyticum]